MKIVNINKRSYEIPIGWEIEKLEYLTEKISDGIHSTPKYICSSCYFFINGNNLENVKLLLILIQNVLNLRNIKNTDEILVLIQF
jgi:hypothetical protein